MGPTCSAPEFDTVQFLKRLRSDDPTRPLGDALLDQRNVAGIGNIWKAEGCWEAGVDPWRPLGTVEDREVVAIIKAVRPRMRRSATEGPRAIGARVYGFAGRPCPRCGGRGQGSWAGRREPDDILVSGMSDVDGSHAAGPLRLRRVGHKGADLIAPGNTYASFDAALAAGVDMIEFDVLPEEHGDGLILAHDYEDAARRVPHTLEEGLAYLASDAFAGCRTRRGPQAARLRVTRARRPARRRLARADADLVPAHAESRAAARRRPERPAWMVGAEADAAIRSVRARRGCRRTLASRRSGSCCRGRPRARSGRGGATR